MIYDIGVSMKSIFITLLMFVAVLCAIRFKLFDVMSSNYVFALSLCFLILTFIFAIKILGLPFSKDEKNDKKQN